MISLEEDRTTERIKLAARIAGRFAARKLLALLLPYLPVIAFVLFVFLLAAVLAAAIYSAFPQAGIYGALTGNKQSEEDVRAQEECESLCNKYNIEDTWLVDGEGSPDHPFYPGKGKEKFGRLVDRYGNDAKLVLDWGQVQAATLYWAYVEDRPEITSRMREDATKGLHPYFYYKESHVTVSTKDGSESYTVYLLVEAYTIQGHFQYHYEWVTETHGEGENAVTVTYEKLSDTKQILPDKWQRLKDWIQKTYKVNQNPDDLELARSAVWEAGAGFTRQKEWLQWLLYQYGGTPSYVSAASVPPELMPFFKEAESMFGIPWWFLAAVADQESSFSTSADNGGAGGVHCYGLMQVSDENWRHYAPLLGFDVNSDRDNPRAQIFVGAYMLSELGLKGVDWTQPDPVWQEKTLPVLAFYGGFRSGGGIDTQRCRVEYAGPIWVRAVNYRDCKSVWPVPGYYHITCGFMAKDDLHPGGHTGIDIGADMGAAVVSVSGGTVVYAGWQNPNDHSEGYGQYVAVRDGVHLYFYGHLSEIYVGKDWPVKPGDIIGAVGSTGHSTGPHLHFEVRDMAVGGNGQPIDPLTVVQPVG